MTSSNGKCVRLTQGDYTQKKEYSSNPLEVAQRFADHGIRRLHLVDLDGAKQRTVVNLRVLEQIATHTSLVVDFGGGVQSDEDLRRVFEAGAQQVTGGSIAVRQPEVFLGWLNEYGADKIILGADARDRLIAISGWQEKSALNVIDFIRDYAQQGVRYVICTDVAKDGLLQGPSFALVRRNRQSAVGAPHRQRRNHHRRRPATTKGQRTARSHHWQSPLRRHPHPPGLGRIFITCAMLTKRIIPCLDVKDGRTVKGINFVQLRDAGDPVELAKIYADEGADELVFLDITATVEKA